MTSHRDWVKISTGDSLRGVARSIGVNQGNFSRQVESGLSADRVIAVAHAYDLSVIDALLDTGHIRPSDDPRTKEGSLTHAIRVLEGIKEELASSNPPAHYEITSDNSPYGNPFTPSYNES